MTLSSLGGAAASAQALHSGQLAADLCLFDCSVSRKKGKRCLAADARSAQTVILHVLLVLVRVDSVLSVCAAVVMHACLCVVDRVWESV